MLLGMDVIREEEKPVFDGPGPTFVPDFAGMDEYERFSPDQDWMPRTTLMAKSTLVWLFQLSARYGRPIRRLDEVPEEELDELARRGFTGLWLIGLWERSAASRTIKQWNGNPEAAASAYSLYDYDIAGELGGWDALADLRERCARRGIRLGSDMVPNHTGIDSRWMAEHPDRFLQLSFPPFPGYNYNCGNLSGRDDFTVQIEEHYFTRSDAAVVFKRTDNRSGHVRYIYHGNDGTSMPWNDTAQIDFLNPEAREAVIRTIVGVCRQFPIVRFDAAMTLAKRHIQRLWYPVPGSGGAIASRAEHAVPNEEFNARIPEEFWREVVDRCAAEAPHTLLLAEAFWMMEGYFVRTLGMHRVYNSAFMNMLKNEENDKYRQTIKNTMEFDPEILKRFVNFMNNPDEETAIAQFGSGDKYFGICTLLVTMPGLPMFGHGQIEGFREKYGMEYRRPYMDESPDADLVSRHEREIFPLLKRRALFSGSADFRLYDLYDRNGMVNENVFAYSNRAMLGDRLERALVFYNNAYEGASGWIKVSDPAVPAPAGQKRRDSLGEALALTCGDDRFVLLRELSSGLWYLRSSKAIYENGFFVALDGYRAQVFIDIREFADDGKGRWARLHHELQGRPVADPEAAILDIYLGDLYCRFTRLLKPETVDRLRAFFVSGGDAEDFVASTRETVAEYLDSLRHHVAGADGRFDPWPAGISPEAPRNPELVEEFSAYLKELLALADTKPGSRTAAARLRREAADRLRQSRAACATALTYGLLALLRRLVPAGEIPFPGKSAAELAFDHWGFGRKLAQRLADYGTDRNESAHLCDLVRAVLTRTGAKARPAKAKTDPRLAAAALVEANYLEGDFQRLLGVNVHNDITWFNKEAFENTVRDGKFLCLLESFLGKPSPKAATRIAEVAAALQAAESASGYKLGGLIRELAGDDEGEA